MSTMPVYTVEKMATTVKSYIDLEIVKERRKTHKEMRKEF